MSNQHPFFPYPRRRFAQNHLNLPPELFRDLRSGNVNMDVWRAQRLASAARFCRLFGPIVRMNMPHMQLHLSHVTLAVPDELRFWQYLSWFEKMAGIRFTATETRPMAWLYLKSSILVPTGQVRPAQPPTELLSYLQIVISRQPNNSYHECMSVSYTPVDGSSPTLDISFPEGRGHVTDQHAAEAYNAL